MESALVAGRVVGDYTLEQLIHHGKFASVFRARQRAPRRDVAVKIVTALDSGTSDAYGRPFTREGEWLSCCEDPHIVRVHGFGTVDGHPFIAMELLVTTLERLLADGPLDPADIVEVGAGMLLGLGAAHRNGVLHGDLKPANLGVDSNGVIKLLDFGAATRLPWHVDVSDRATGPLPSICCGTLHYMAPEQLLGRPLDERTDICGAGAVLYEVATGRPPYPVDQAAALVGAILHCHPDPPSTINRRLPRGFDTLAHRALAKSPSARYQSVWEMMDALLTLRPWLRDSCGDGIGTRLSSLALSPSDHGFWFCERTDRPGFDPAALGTSAGGG